MNDLSSSTSSPAVGPEAAPMAPLPARRLFAWSVRRELWEHRWVWRAPLLVAAVVIFASLVGTLGLPAKLRGAAALDAAGQHAALVRPFGMAPAPIMLATFLLGFFYSIDALHGERRDRSILFWKSLPVSDLTTVLAKASIPLVVLPLIALALSLVAFGTLLVATTLVLAASGDGPARVWTEVRFVQEPLVMIYGLSAHALWFAPIHGWLLVVSAWARRVPVLWAVLPPLVIAAAEQIVFGTSHLPALLGDRFSGAMTEAFVLGSEHAGAAGFDQLSQLDPARFLASPGLWTGLAFAAGCLAVAVRLRRTRQPI